MKAKDIEQVNQWLEDLDGYNKFLDSLNNEDTLFCNEIEMQIQNLKSEVLCLHVFINMFKNYKHGIVKYIIKQIENMRDSIISDLKHMGVDYES